MPAMMKGYADRVLVAGFAYKYQNGGPVGLMNNKPLLVLNTTGTPDEMMTASGIKDVIFTTMNKGIYEFCGFKVQHHFFYAVPFVTTEIRKEYLNKIKDYL